MKLHELMSLLRNVNQEAEVTVAVEVAYSEYTTGSEQRPVTGIVTWPSDNPHEATLVEIVREG